MVTPATSLFTPWWLLAVVPISPSYRNIYWTVSILLLAIATVVWALRYPHAARHIGLVLWDYKWTLPLIAILGLGIFSWVHRSVESVPASAEFQVDQDWPMDRGGLTRLGATPSSSRPPAGHIAWTHDRLDEAFYSSAAVSGRYLFTVGSRDDRGRIYCFDQVNGQTVWTCEPPDYAATFSSPVIAGDFLICGEGLHHTRQARVVAIDLRPGRAGRVAWSFRTNSHVECTPVVDSGCVYFGAGDDGIYCLDPGNIVNGSPQVRFHLPGSKYPDAETSLAVHDGRIYAGLGKRGEALCILDATTGREIARLPTPFPVFSPPSIADGKLYVGMGVGDYVTPDKTPEGAVWCVDLAAQTTDWRLALDGTVLGSVAMLDHQLYFGSSNGCIYALTLDGQIAHKFDTRAPILTSLAVTAGSIFAVNQAGRLFCLGRDDLSVVWEVTLGSSGRFISSPVAAGDRVFVGTEKQGFICIGPLADPARVPNG